MKILFVLLLLPALCLAEPASVVRSTELKKDPATDAPTLAQLAEDTQVDALERKGGWTRVKAAEGVGWVKMLSLRFGGAGGAKQGDSGVSQLLNVARTGSSGTQVTTGVRGLDAELLANARPNPEELRMMQDFGATKEAAAEFAASGSLQARQVEVPQ
ncbi:MAG: hypothetical protein AB7O31_01680 [Burkholderiales bacterium]